MDKNESKIDVGSNKFPDKPMLVRQLSLNSKVLLEKAFSKLDSKGTGFIDRKKALEDYTEICAKVNSPPDEAAAMMLSEFDDDKISFEEWANFFKSIQDQQKLEEVLAVFGF